MNTVIEITPNKYEIKSVWGGQQVIVSAICKIQHTKSHAECYEIVFSRDQISGHIREIECLDREEMTTSEYTLTKERVCELAEEFLEY